MIDRRNAEIYRYSTELYPRGDGLCLALFLENGIEVGRALCDTREDAEEEADAWLASRPLPRPPADSRLVVHAPELLEAARILADCARGIGDPRLHYPLESLMRVMHKITEGADEPD